MEKMQLRSDKRREEWSNMGGNWAANVVAAMNKYMELVEEYNELIMLSPVHI